MRKIILSFLGITMLFLIGCSKTDENPVTPNPEITHAFKVGEAYVSGAKLQVYADDSLRTGYNRIYYKLTDSASGAVIQSAQITAKQVMVMTTKSHTSPIEQPATTATNNWFAGAAVFTMPTSDMGTWRIDFKVKNNSNNREDTTTIPVKIINSAYCKVVTGSDSLVYVVSLIPISKPVVGLNDIEFTIHQKVDMWNFPALTGLTTVMTPDMPSMGHGSPNNVDPIHTSMGHYKGKVNFTMTGEWRITLDVKSNGNIVLSTPYYITL